MIITNNINTIYQKISFLTSFAKLNKLMSVAYSTLNCTTIHIVTLRLSGCLQLPLIFSFCSRIHPFCGAYLLPIDAANALISASLENTIHAKVYHLDFLFLAFNSERKMVIPSRSRLISHFTVHGP